MSTPICKCTEEVGCPSLFCVRYAECVAAGHGKAMTRFRQDNTEGYGDADLAAMNEAFERIVAEDHYCEMPDPKSAEDHLSANIQYAFDNGLRGFSLVVFARAVREDLANSRARTPPARQQGSRAER